MTEFEKLLIVEILEETHKLYKHNTLPGDQSKMLWDRVRNITKRLLGDTSPLELIQRKAC